MKSIAPCLWFDHEGEEAAKFYTSIIKRSKITQVTHYGDNMPRPKGGVMTVAFELNGQPFLALNGGPSDKQPQRSHRVMEAVMKMRKLEIAGLERAYASA